MELPEVLAEGGGAGEEEESMMWYAWNHEKYDEESSFKDRQGKAEEDEAWKKRWMGRLERREYGYFLRRQLS